MEMSICRHIGHQAVPTLTIPMKTEYTCLFDNLAYIVLIAMAIPSISDTSPRLKSNFDSIYRLQATDC